MKWLKRFWADHNLTVVLLALVVVQTVGTWWLYEPYLPKKMPMRHFWGLWFMSIVADTYGALLLIAMGIKFRERSSRQDG